MGNNLSQDLASGEFGLTLEDQVRIQLVSNHYPPLPVEMVGACVEAIHACNEDDPDRLIDLPEVMDMGEMSQVRWRGEPQAPAWALVQGHHLDAWIEALDD
jgi:hypothetical protein